jgi:hypothetical protein
MNDITEFYSSSNENQSIFPDQKYYIPFFNNDYYKIAECSFIKIKNNKKYFKIDKIVFEYFINTVDNNPKHISCDDKNCFINYEEALKIVHQKLKIYFEIEELKLKHILNKYQRDSQDIKNKLNELYSNIRNYYKK